MTRTTRIAITTVATLSVLLLTAAPYTAAAVEFDEDRAIQTATNLPSTSPVSATIRGVQWALGILGLVAVIMVLTGGIIWMTAAGNEERVKRAKTILFSAVIGLTVILLSGAIVTFVFARAGDVTK
ncbi:MAG: hypothetical protein V1916_02925 [Patescibacteria group bacterium]